MDFLIELDRCDYYIEKVENMFENLHYTPSLLFIDEIFEEKTASAKTQLVNNEKNKEQSSSGGIANGIGKIIESIKNIIKGIIEKIVNFIQVLTLSGDEKRQYEAFVQKCASHPKLKNKQITVMDYKKYYGDYKRLLAEVEKADKDLASGKSVEVEMIENKIKKFIAGAAAGAVTSVTLAAGLRQASGSRQYASMMLEKLKNDEEEMARIEAAIGKKEAQNYVKDLKSLTHRFSLKRYMMRATGNAAMSLESANKGVLNDAIEAVNAVKDLGLPGYDPEKNVLMNMLSKAAHIAKHPKKAFAAGKALLKNKDLYDMAMGNEQIRDAVDVAKKVEYGKNNAARGDALAKRGIPGEQTAFAFISGVNDPKSRINKSEANRKKDFDKYTED